MKAFLVILLVFALSISAFNVDQRMIDDSGTTDEDATNEPITNTPTTPVVTTPSTTTTQAPTTPEVTTTAPPPPIVKPSIPDKIEDIVEEIVKEEVATSPNTNANTNTVEKETIVQPPITVNNETTNNFIEKINSISSGNTSSPQPTFPEVTTKPDTVQTKPAQSKLTSFDFPKKTTYLGVDVSEMTEKPALTTGTLGNSEEKTSIVVSSSKPTTDSVSLNILSTVESAYIVNTEIDIFATKSSSSRRMLADDKNIDVLEISECGIFNNITNTTMENVKINIYGNVILNCTNGYNGIFANTINDSHLINVRIEFMNKNSRIITVDGTGGQVYGLIAGRIYNSAVYYVRVTGDILNIRDKAKNTGGNERMLEEKSDIIVSPLFGEVESTDIVNSYVDINNVLIKSDSIVYGGIAGNYIPGIPTIDRISNNTELPPVLNNTFAIIRNGLTLSSESGSRATIGGLIGEVNYNNAGDSVIVESCYSSATMNGLDHPKLQYGGFIGQLDNTTFNFTFSYSVMNVKSAYLHDNATVASLVFADENATNINYDRCYGYISSPFILNRTDNYFEGNLTYYFIKSYSFNKTDILVRYLQSQPLSSSGVLVYGNGADKNDENYKEPEEAVNELKNNGYIINPYNKQIPINKAPGVTPGGLYGSKESSQVWGTTFNPTSRAQESGIKVDFVLLPNPISTRKICPNNCNGNGKCMNGICYCNEGYNGVYCQYKTCPYGYMFNDPSINSVNTVGTAQVCSNQGYCNKETGFCECFAGFEGNACQRKQCPNSCSNHGICITINKVESEDMVDYDMKYLRQYNESDGEKVQVCVCDEEYEGYDCSLRKCPVGYSQMSDCDSQPQSTITFTFNSVVAKKKIYLKYTDPLGKVWYTIGFDYTERDEWIKGLTSLPPGTISIDRIDDITATGATNKVIQVTYSKSQTGRQVPIEVLTYEQVKTLSEQYPFIKNENLLPDGVIVSAEDSLPTSPCSGNGICDSVKGLCNCFSGFYGNSCASHSSVL